MSWRFRRRVKLIPGVYLNFSKSGISTSVGFRGASINIGKHGTYLNSGIPGTGIYNRQKISSDNKKDNLQKFPSQEAPFTESEEGSIISVDADEITSQNMQGIKEAIINANQQRQDLNRDISKVNSTMKFTKTKLILSYIFLIGFFRKKIKNNILRDIETQKNTIAQLELQKENSFVNLDIDFDDEIKVMYEKVVLSFKNLISSIKIWDITHAVHQDNIASRSFATTIEQKKEVRFEYKSLEDIKSKYSSLLFKNANGSDMYFYPNFIVVKASEGKFGLVDFKELEFRFSTTRFEERDQVPKDSKVIDTTWAKVNKNGTPDKRFKDNYQIPIVRYGTINLKTATGLNEEYEFSNYEYCEQFAQDFLDYQKIINSLHHIEQDTSNVSQRFEKKQVNNINDTTEIQEIILKGLEFKYLVSNTNDIDALRTNFSKLKSIIEKLKSYPESNAYVENIYLAIASYIRQYSNRGELEDESIAMFLKPKDIDMSAFYFRSLVNCSTNFYKEKVCEINNLTSQADKESSVDEILGSATKIREELKTNCSSVDKFDLALQALDEIETQCVILKAARTIN